MKGDMIRIRLVCADTVALHNCYMVVSAGEAIAAPVPIEPEKTLEQSE